MTFTFVLMISLILTLLEGARAAAASACADMQMTTSVESVLGEFYRPLFDKYAVFGIDTGFSQSTPDASRLADMMMEYGATGSFGLEPVESRITSTSPLLTPDGGEFFRQAVAYEENCAITDTAQKLIERFQLLAKQGRAYTIYERKMEIDDRLATIDRNTLKLMENIDGVVTSFGRAGYANDSFIKKLMTGPVDMSTTGINNPEVFLLLENCYVNPFTYSDAMSECFENAAASAILRDEKAEEIQTTEVEYNEASQALSLLEDEYRKKEEAKESGGEDSEDKEAIAQEQEEEPEELQQAREGVSALSEKLSALREEYEELNNEVKDSCLSGAVYADELMRLYESSRCLVADSLELISEDREISSVTEPLIEAFGELLDSSRDILSRELLESLSASYLQMRKYTGLDGQKPDYESIGDTLSADGEIYMKILDCVNVGRDISQKAERFISASDISGWSGNALEAGKLIGQVSYEGLNFDYSKITTQSQMELMADELEGQLAEGILSMVLGADVKLSDKKLSGMSLPSAFLDETVNIGDISELVLEGLDNSSGASAFTSLNTAADTEAVALELESEGEDFWDKILFLLYITEHFGSFADEVMTGEGALEYEQEYILCRERYDSTNLMSVASRIFLIRMVTAGSYVLTDASLGLKAEEMAMTIVGFTDLPFLVSIVKYAILFGWSAQQALVETAAILAGKKVPVLTTSASFCIEPVNILTLSRAAIQVKVKVFYESSFSLLYEDYLLFLMLAESATSLTLGAMDLVQENIRWAYDDKFYLANCITGFSAEMTMSCPARYMSLFSGIYGDVSAPGGYSFIRSGSISY